MKETLEFIFSHGWVYIGVTLWIMIIAGGLSGIGSKD